MRLYLIIVFCLSTIGYSSAQNCNCTSNFEWLKKVFEENDAGYQYIINKKGQTAYNIHNQLIRDRLINIETQKECLNLLNDWTDFFRKHHLSVQLIMKESTISQDSLFKEKSQTTNTKSSEVVNEEEFRKPQKKSIEGLWISKNYIIGISKDTLDNDFEYTGIFFEAQNPMWSKHQLKLKISNLKNDNEFEFKFLMGTHKSKVFKGKLINDNKEINVAEFEFYRKGSEKANYYENKFLKSPYIKKLSLNTILIGIPSFKRSYFNEIDSLLIKNHNLIVKTKNLIIDVRDNYGGSDKCHGPLMKYLYTNPILIPMAEYLSTNLNNQRMIEFGNSKDVKFSKYGKKSFELLSQNLGKFVNTRDTDVYEWKLDSILENPQNIAILINENCASATEGFIYQAKQSRKVKFYGNTSMGAFDISNMYFTNSPCDEFKLGYGLSKRIGLTSKNKIDDIGFQPDYYLGGKLEEYQWINYVHKQLENILVK